MDPLRVTCTLKVKANAVKQEYEKQDELKRSALRALAALASIPKAGRLKFVQSQISSQILSQLFVSISALTDKNQQLAEFLKFIRESPELNNIFQSVQKDSLLTAPNSSASSSSTDNLMDQS